MRPVSLLLFVAVLIVAGCRHDSNRDSLSERLSTSELGWVRDYSEWAIEISDDDEDGSESGTQALSSCQEAVEGIRKPPTERLEAAAAILPEVCLHLAHQGSRRRALDLVDRADDLVYALFLDDQPLDLGTGLRAESYADVELSQRVTTRLERPIEVRCWTDADWRRLLVEDDAWNDDTTDADDLVGWMDDTQDRIHIVLEYCNTMTDVLTGDVSDWGRDERIDAADAIETLMHEVQHFLLPDASEAKAECRAIQSLPRFAQRFGVGPAVARELEDLYRAEIYPDLDEEYTRGGCPRS